MNLLTLRFNTGQTINEIEESFNKGTHEDGSAIELDLLAKWLIYATYLEGRFGRQHPLLQSCKHKLLTGINQKLMGNPVTISFDTLSGVLGLVTVEVWHSPTTQQWKY